MREGSVAQRTVLELTGLGGLGMRNNVGVAFDQTGRPIRYGLMNETKEVNTEFKSSDLIDCIPILIQPHHVGRTFGLFVAIETKRTDWKYKPNDSHSVAQRAFHLLVRQRGGAADFVNDPRQVAALLGIYK